MVTFNNVSSTLKRLIFKYWIFNLLISFLLYISYRIAIMDTAASGDGLLATLLLILDIAINLGLSLMYLAAMILCSFTIYLNLISKIRNSHILSWLSFSGAPILLLVLFIISLTADGYQYRSGVMTKILVFSVLYLCATTLLFIGFRKSYSAKVKVANRTS